jgi:CTP synthase
MRLGAYDCKLADNSIAVRLYGKKLISERHRHRYEVNDKYVEAFSQRGLVVTGRNPQSNLIEIMELNDHPFFIGTQSHPEFKSRLVTPSPLFVGLVQAAKGL